jgi:hypothetical protein
MTQNATPPLDSDAQAWLEDLEVTGEARGYFESVGPAHSAILTDEGPVLIVTFETVQGIRARGKDAQPYGFDLVADNGYSNLCILAHSDTWFRDASLYGYFDRLVDDGFFEDFDQVVFYGAGMCGYGATAFCVAAPGATVIALQPQATLDPTVAGWDKRFMGKRRTCFTDRYGFAPDMVEGADRAFIMYDPEEDMDAMHAALFTRPHVHPLPCPNMGATLEREFLAMEILTPMIETACTGDFTPADFYELYRARRDHGPYLRNLLRRLDDDGRIGLTGALCRNVLSRMSGPRFRRRLNEIEAQQQAAKDTPRDTRIGTIRAVRTLSEPTS